jgi:hypothetical protein
MVKNPLDEWTYFYVLSNQLGDELAMSNPKLIFKL